MSATLPNGVGEEQITGTFSRQEWSTMLAALYEAPLPLKLTGRLAGKVQQLLAPQTAPVKEGTS
jgi:hypothetical protein